MSRDTGPVGSGKSSLLEGMIGEMRRTAGSVKFKGSVAYCPQSAWIQNATVRDNILFGRPFDEERYWKAVHDACLEADLELLPNGDLTEVGERGISLSGGERQRLAIARALLRDPRLLVLDEAANAIDAASEAALLERLAALDPRPTIIMISHRAESLVRCDQVVTIELGRLTANYFPAE